MMNSVSWVYTMHTAYAASRTHEDSTIPIFVTEKLIVKPNDVSVFSALSINGRLFACPRDQLNSLVRDECFPCLLGTSEAFIKWVYRNAYHSLVVVIIL